MSIKVTVDDIINALASDGTSISVSEARNVLESLNMDSIEQAASYATDNEEKRELIHNEICAFYWSFSAEQA